VILSGPGAREAASAAAADAGSVRITELRARSRPAGGRARQRGSVVLADAWDGRLARLGGRRSGSGPGGERRVSRVAWPPAATSWRCATARGRRSWARAHGAVAARTGRRRGSCDCGRRSGRGGSL
jgi:hypothetical protein